MEIQHQHHPLLAARGWYYITAVRTGANSPLANIIAEDNDANNNATAAARRP